jgi:hypothetical protein
MDKKEQPCTDFLFSKAGLLVGAGSIYNIAGNYFNFNYSDSEHQADLKALRADWEMAAKDLQNATSKEENISLNFNEYASCE